MKKLLPSLAAVALLALTACQQKEPEVLSETSVDPQAAAIANRAPVELPPSIKADKSMRCQPGNVLFYVTFFEGDKLAMVRTERTGTPARLTAANAGDPLKADGGWELTGTPTSAKIAQPGKGSFTCKG